MPAAVDQRIQRENELHRRRLLGAFALVVGSFVLAACVLGGGVVSPRQLAPLLALGVTAGSALVLSRAGRVELGLGALAAVVVATLADAHALLRVSLMAPAYAALLMVLASTLVPWRSLAVYSGLLGLSVIGMRLLRADGEIAVTLDAVTLLVGVSAILLVDRRRIERDRELLREALNQAHEANTRAEAAAAGARDASEAKSEFLARISHELRTPINAILGFAELIDEGADLDDETRGDLGKIRTAGAHLLALVDDVLDLSRVESGKLALRVRPISLDRLLGPAAEIAAQLARGKGNRLVVDVPTDEVTVDPRPVHQVVLNLLANAAKFTEEGVITLRARAGRDEVEIEVIDTGIGIRTERLPFLFQPFVQAERDTSYKYGGTGLGLAISDRFVRAMGGRIEVESRIGRGSRFRVMLPRRLDALHGHRGLDGPEWTVTSD